MIFRSFHSWDWAIVSVILEITAIYLFSPTRIKLQWPKNQLSGGASAKWKAVRTTIEKLPSNQLGLSIVIGLGCGFVLLMITGSAPIAMLVTTSATGLSVRSFALNNRQNLEDAALTAWPDILGELQLRIGTLGSPLPNALFTAGKSADSHLNNAFVTAERSFAITGSFDIALSTLRSILQDQGTRLLTELLAVVKGAPGTDVARLVDELRQDRAAERDRESEYAAKLAGVKFARYFVIAVPVGMMMAGIGIAGFAPYRTPVGEFAIAGSVVLLIGCWSWASHLANPKKLKVKTGK